MGPQRKSVMRTAEQVSPTNAQTNLRELNFREAPQDFSLVLGGPLFQLFRKSHLAREGLELLYRRVATLPPTAWLPLLLLAPFSPAPRCIWPVSFFLALLVEVHFHTSFS